MKADLSRQTFDPKKRYSSVLMQQGRVQLDAEWNEQQEIHQHRAQTGARDVIGARGTPIDHDGGATGFEITARDGTLFIGEGHIYVDGILCVNEGEEQLSYEEQPDLPSAEDLRGWMDGVESEEAGLKPGLVFLDVWERHVTHLDDDRIREVALGGPDTTTRKQTVWQTKVMALDPEKDDAELLARYAELRAKSEPSEAEEAELEEISPQAVEVLNALCERGEAALDELGEPPTGNLSARAEEESDATGPCEIPPGSGYERLENQLYRVEVHRSGNRGTARFKWSRDNGCVATGIEEVDVGNKEITVKDTGRDEFLSFANGQWVEVVDDNTELRGEYRTLLQIDEPVDHARRVITVRQTPPAIDPALHPKLRRWDQQIGATEDGVVLTDTGTELEDGIEVTISSGQYRAGDYWLIPARTATGDVEWPRADPENPDSGPAAVPSRGVRHSFCALAIVAAMPDGDSEENRLTVLHDCRHLFPQLTNLTGFFYVGGDGQEAPPPKPNQPRVRLRQPLRVGVANGQWPVAGARVKFNTKQADLNGTVELEGGPPGTSLIVSTDDEGVAECYWRLGNLTEDRTNLSQRVEATLLGPADQTRHLPINFNASVSVADEVGYTPGGACTDLDGVTTVQEAIDELCKAGENVQGIHIRDVRTVEPDAPLLNDASLLATLLVGGVRVVCDMPIDENALNGKPTCFVTLDLPFPFTPFPLEEEDESDEQHPVVGYQPLILRGNVVVEDESILWVAADDVKPWLSETLFNQMLKQNRGNRVLAHLTLKGNFIWGREDQAFYLDGDSFGVPEGGTTTLDLPSGDRRRGGDFEMWFWLVPPRIILGSVNVPPEVTGGVQTVTGTLRIIGIAPAGGISIQLNSDKPGMVSVPNSVTIPAGQSSGTFPINTQAVRELTTARITATLTTPEGTQQKTGDLVVQPPVLSSMAVNPKEVIGKTMPRPQGTVVLTGPAPPGGIDVNLGSNNPTIVKIPSRVAVPAGTNSAGFSVDTEPVNNRTRVDITASSQNVTKTDTLTVKPPVPRLTFSPERVGGPPPSPQRSTGTITLNGPAPSGEVIQITKTVNENAVRLLVTTVSVPPNAMQVTFEVQAVAFFSGQPRTDRITASYLGDSSTAPIACLPLGG